MKERSVLLSLKDRWWGKMLTGEKSLEVRKTMPKQMECVSESGRFEYPLGFRVFVYLSGTGHIIGHFDCGKIEVFESAFSEWAYSVAPPGSIMPMSDTWAFKLMREKGCLTDDDINTYFGDEDFIAYFWHVSEPTEYETPIPLSAFGMKRPPQSWCYTEYIHPAHRE